MPTINFTENSIIASYFGSKSTGGYSIEILGIFETADQVNVYVGEIYPEGPVTLAVTHPFHIVKTEKITKSILFKHIIINNILYDMWKSSLDIRLIIILVFANIILIRGIVFYTKLSKRKLED